MTKADVITLLIIGALVVAVLFGKRAGRAQLAAALSAARAEGHATATTELRAQLTQAVNVSVASSSSESGETTRELEREFSDIELAAIRHALTVPIGAYHDASATNQLGAVNGSEPAWVDSRERSRLIRTARSDRHDVRGGAAALNVGSRPPQEIVDL